MTLSGCASEADRNLREYQRYVARSKKEKAKRQAAYLKSRQQAPLPAQGEQAQQASQPKYDVQMEAVPVQ